MRSRNSSKHEWSGEPPPEHDTFLALLTMGVLVVFLVAVPFLARDMFVRDIYGPLLNSDPFVRVNYAYFAFPALMFGGTIGLVLGVLAQVRHWLGTPVESVMPFVRWCMKGLWVCLVLMFALPTMGGLATERYVKAQGYVYCGKLFELGVATYSRGYVTDPRVCVNPSSLAATLERYGYSDAARRYRFEKE